MIKALKPAHLMGAALTLTVVSFASHAIAQETGVNAETAFILNSFMFLICGALVMWMAAGFAMLESGFVRAKNTSAICLKNILLYAIAGIAYYIIGYNLMYVDVSGFIGSFSLFYNPTETEAALSAAEAGSDAYAGLTTTLTDESSYAAMSDWFFQMVFVATAASIVSGTLAERIKLWPFLLFVTILTGLVYPIQGAWSWGGGWLSGLGFSDFAGSTIVHSVGGWAALTGAVILGPRLGKYDTQGRVKPLPGSNMPLATIGTFILWMGWFGFNGGSVLALDSAQAASKMSLVFVNTNLAAAAGVVAATAFAQIRFGKPDLTLVLNGALAGLVAITAGPDIANPLFALLIGAIGGLLCSAAVPLLDKFKIDDVVGAIPVHLVCGIWGTLAVGIFNSSVSLTAQLIGIAATGVFVSVISAALWLALKFTIGIRVSERDERIGLDRAEIGVEAYPEFDPRPAQ